MPARYKQSLRDIGWLMIEVRNKQRRLWPENVSYRLSMDAWLPRTTSGDIDNIIGTDDRQVVGFDRCSKYLLPSEPKVVVEVRTSDKLTGFEAPSLSRDAGT
jgi:hypothetical protein